MNLKLSYSPTGQQLPVDSLDYRGIHIDFYEDSYGEQLFTYWKENRLDFGADNYNYKEDARKLIDYELDTIDYIQDQFGPMAKLSWFQNGGHRDIKLTLEDRLIKVFLVADDTQVNLENIRKEALDIIVKLDYKREE